METAEKLAYKEQLKLFCQERIEQRIAAARQSISNAQDAANSEEKSSAGDKYETGRAMGHLQKDMYARQLAAYLKELAGLQAVNTGTLYNEVKPGTFITAGGVSFFIAAGLGKQMVDGKEIFFLSPHAPLAIALQNKKAGAGLVFNGKNLAIETLF